MPSKPLLPVALPRSRRVRRRTSGEPGPRELRAVPRRLLLLHAILHSRALCQRQLQRGRCCHVLVLPSGLCVSHHSQRPHSVWRRHIQRWQRHALHHLCCRVPLPEHHRPGAGHSMRERHLLARGRHGLPRLSCRVVLPLHTRGSDGPVPTRHVLPSWRGLVHAVPRRVQLFAQQPCA